MKAIAVNGSPRKKWNTATLLTHALAGAEVQGAQTRLVHLYDLDYKGCISCFSCKRLGGTSYGRCAVQDGLTPLLEEVAQADVLILGSPLYFRTESGEMRSFMERLHFQYLTYAPGYASLFPRKIQTAFVYTMNVPEEAMPAIHQDTTVASGQAVMQRTFGSCELLLATDTYQFDDYSKYLSTAFDAEAKARRREEFFPQDCARAYNLGARLTQAAKAAKAG